MKRTLLYFCIIFLSVFSQEKAVNAIDTSNMSAEIAKVIGENAALFPNNTQLSIALIDGETTKYIGIIRQNDSLQHIDNKDAIFEIGSNTKVFTSLLLSHQIHAGNLQLNDKLVNVLPFSMENSPEKATEITLQMLSNHTSGLPRLPQNIFPLLEKNMANPYKDYTVEMLHEYLKSEFTLDNEPGKVSAYSNLGAGLLGYVLTEKTKKTYEDLLQETILKPLGMSHTTTLLSKIDASQLVKGLQPDGTETSNWDFTDALVGAGGMKSNVVDMEKFIRKNFEDDTIYNVPQQATIDINKMVQMGLGWHIVTKEGKTVLFHNGGTGGYLSCMIVDKKNKKAALLLSNVSAFSPQGPNIDNLCFTLISLL
ncbi:D-alanyl-D-alanine- carboxypeptidase/endopeptidase AmpH [Kordia sp. SMS9]|uniref:serine hydrolase domain-containing protein n=1 Tax=Kordia sp. SMS9 TaxID=2282170 RepID=UPI000E0D517C|nr:serine hydrolase domain-containing protein [Kordia sp. SMS9]AXG68911.1 D-alanyl-D-alanine- carboxypeptidase/endopeptidase AmpH [Kordia sp. SMS9]